jgi:hypothetical protein
MSQLFFRIPREYAFLFFHNNRDTAFYCRWLHVYFQGKTNLESGGIKKIGEMLVSFLAETVVQELLIRPARAR